MSVDKVIQCNWTQHSDKVQIARLVDRERSAEGLDYIRYKTEDGGIVNFDSSDGHIISLVEGKGTFTSAKQETPLNLEAPTHVYIPKGFDGKLELIGKSLLVQVTAPGERARGKQLLVRNEKYARAVRFILTPQYISRRIFVNRDQTLLSCHNQPVSIFHTTMFDTNGLPVNFEKIPVFKMGYNYQSEPNNCYNVKGNASVRFAHHPYVSADKQQWTEWSSIGNDVLYYLNETEEGVDVEWYTDPNTQEKLPLRNRHEVSVSSGGSVNLICLFDPAPTGLEKHTPGEYSCYTPVSTIVNTDEYKKFLQEVSSEDEMMDELSMMEAQRSEKLKSSKYWKIYENCLENKIKADNELYGKLKSDGKGRENVIQQWMVNQTF